MGKLMEIKISNAKEKEKIEWIEKSNFDKGILEKVIHIDDGYSFISKHNEELIGIISIYIRNIFENNSLKEIYIDLIEVDENYRRMKVATNLLQKVVEFSKMNGIYQLRAWSSLDKEQAIKLWKNHKFCFNPVTMKKNNSDIQGVYVTKLIEESSE